MNNTYFSVGILLLSFLTFGFVFLKNRENQLVDIARNYRTFSQDVNARQVVTDSAKFKWTIALCKYMGEETMGYHYEFDSAFLEEKLAYFDLNRKEANEFIVYWLPKMEKNAFNLIHFSSAAYEELAPLTIEPAPETIIRVMMITTPLENNVDFPVQDLSSMKKVRKGFTVVEWGGSICSNAFLTRYF